MLDVVKMMDARVQIVIFDIDGTLVVEEHSQTAHSSIKEVLFNDVLNEFLNVKEIDFRRSSVDGYTDWLISERAIAKAEQESTIDSADWEYITSEITRRFLSSPVRQSFEGLKELSGVKALLNELSNKSICLGLVTGNLQCFAEAKLSQTGLLSYFACGAFGENGRSRTDILKHLISPLRIKNPLSIVFIGDTLHDAEAADMAGIKFIGVGTSKMTEEELLNAFQKLSKIWVKDLTCFEVIKSFIGEIDIVR